MSFDFTADPGTDPKYCDSISAEPDDEIRFQCLYCGVWTKDERYWPMCSPECVSATARDTELDHQKTPAA